MAEIKSLLDKAIESEFQSLSSLSSGSEEKSKVIDDLAALHKLRIEEIKAEAEAEEKRARRVMDDMDRERDEQFKQRQLSEQIIDRYVKVGTAAAELMLPLVFYGVWMKRGLKFEETGTFTSTTFKNLLGRFKPTRKS